MKHMHTAHTRSPVADSAVRGLGAREGTRAGLADVVAAHAQRQQLRHDARLERVREGARAGLADAVVVRG